MPTVLRVGAYRFFFYSNEAQEPPHIHVQEGRKLAKFWLHPVRLAASTRFRSHEVRGLAKIVEEHETVLLEAWNEHFAT